MRVLVGYATAHGSTTGIATRIGERLAGVGCEVDVRPVEEVVEVGPYDAVVLGSAVHDTTWLPQARRFVLAHRAALTRRPVWFFSVSSVGDTSSFLPPPLARALRQVASEPKGIARIGRAIGARGHHNFAGVIQPSHWNLKDRVVFRATGGRYGDHRDWVDIDEWASTIAASLRSASRATSA